ncbi:MAG: 1-phosphofructokinase family hexose kinase [Anaerolineales bacterium]
MILCVTPNPAIDRTLYVNSLHLGEVHRAEKVLTAAGGKGLNVARTIHTLGGEPFCMGLVGGHTGNLFSDLARQEGLSAQWTKTKNETRTCVILVEEGRDATVVNECGVEVNVETTHLFCNDVWEMSARTDLVCVSGSLPPGFSVDNFRLLLSGLVERKKSVWVDTSGTALKTALGVHGVSIKVNAAELGESLGLEISNMELAVMAGKKLLAQGISSIAITLGKDGAVLITESGVWTAHPPAIEVVSTVGSGDAFLGGLAFALDSGNLPETALRYGTAAGAANALHFGGGTVTREEFDKLCTGTLLK